MRQDDVLTALRTSGAPMTSAQILTASSVQIEDCWERSNQVRTIYARLHSLERFGLVRRAGKTGSQILWEAVQ